MRDNYINDIKHIKKVFADLIIDDMLDFDQDNIISWKNYLPGISKNLYSKEYESLRDTRQYSFLLKNKGLVQFFYSFEDKKLLKAKLCYYPFPVVLKESLEEVEGYYDETEDVKISEYYYDLWNVLKGRFGDKIDDDEMLLFKEITLKLGLSELELLEQRFERKYPVTNTSHIRFDYDDKVESHNKFEIQYSSINSLRIPFKTIISPFLFMDFIVRNEFKKDYSDLSKKPDYKKFYSIALSNSKEVTGFSHDNFYGSHD